MSRVPRLFKNRVKWRKWIDTCSSMISMQREDLKIFLHSFSSAEIVHNILVPYNIGLGEWVGELVSWVRWVRGWLSWESGWVYWVNCVRRVRWVRWVCEWEFELVEWVGNPYKIFYVLKNLNTAVNIIF